MSTPGDPHDPSLPRDFGTNSPDPDFKLAPIFSDLNGLTPHDDREDEGRQENTDR